MAKYYIGWDVGAWHCNKKTKKDKSQDAIAILDERQNLIGGFYEGNLKDRILETAKQDAPDDSEKQIKRVKYFLETLFRECNPDSNKEPDYSNDEFFIAIDTPLGWPKAFRELLERWSSSNFNEFASLDFKGSKNNNPLLTRQTEKRFGNPLSAIQDQIGSQSTKAMYLLSSFKPSRSSTGVWKTQCPKCTIIETYPAPCMRSLEFLEHMKGIKLEANSISSSDKFDALVCAYLAWCFNNPPISGSDLKCVQIDSPHDNIDPAEGWIFTPKDYLDHTLAISYTKLIGTKMDGLDKLLLDIQIGIVLSAKKKRNPDADDWAGKYQNLFTDLTLDICAKLMETLYPSWFKKGDETKENQKRKKDGKYSSKDNLEKFRNFLGATIDCLKSNATNKPRRT